MDRHDSIAFKKAASTGCVDRRYTDASTQSRKRIKRVHVDHVDSSSDRNTHDDALLLAAFADIASKTIRPSPITPCGNNCPSYPGSSVQSRPRTVSNENSAGIRIDGKITSIQQATMGSKKRPIEIQPKQTEMQTPAVVYTTILKKKFSWKNYPTLEKFLIANRDEYLRHSTLNYTVQQKQYNNHLTKQMIALAAQCGLIFDDNDFSFVTIRDRIRCYYKSYVQSLKKRGVLLGYAARKAGLVSDNDIEISASTAGKIYLPKV